MLDRVREFAVRQQLWRPDTRVIAALSGGSDSVALLLLLRELHTAGELVLDCAAHLNHRTRGAESDQDEAFCRALCTQIGIELVAGTTDVPAAAARDRASLEVAGRRARHAFFQDVLRGRRADRVATAHTEDDQAETVLLRILRGSGGRGLAGIRPRRAHLIRPLLPIGRQELRDYLDARGQIWREDASNAELFTPRNRIRGELLPYLARHFNPAVSAALARLADVAREEDVWLDQWVTDLAGRLISCSETQVTLTVTGFAGLPHGLARRVGRRALELATPGRFFSVREVDRLLSVVTGRVSAAEISGLRVERFRDSEVLIKRALLPRRRRRGTRV